MIRLEDKRISLNIRLLLFVIACAAIVLGGWFLINRISEGEAGYAAQIEPLLQGLYETLQIADQSTAYDQMTGLVCAERVSDMFLETQRLKGGQDARPNIDEVEVVRVKEISRDGMGGVEVDVVWTVASLLRHDDHAHANQNRYRARIGLSFEGDRWRLCRIEVEENL